MISRAAKHFYSRGFTQLVKPTLLTTQAFSIQSLTMRQFSSTQSDDEAARDSADEVVDTPEPQETS